MEETNTKGETFPPELMSVGAVVNILLVKTACRKCIRSELWAGFLLLHWVNCPLFYTEDWFIYLLIALQPVYTLFTPEHLKTWTPVSWKILPAQLSLCTNHMYWTSLGKDVTGGFVFFLKLAVQNVCLPLLVEGCNNPSPFKRITSAEIQPRLQIDVCLVQILVLIYPAL